MPDTETNIHLDGRETKLASKVVPESDVAPVGPYPLKDSGVVVRKLPIPTNCAQCGARTVRDPGTLPFSTGPYKGGFFCKDCWTLHWDEHPELLADAATRAEVAEKAREIRLRRAGNACEILAEADGARAYLTPRGTVFLEIPRNPFGGPDEFDPARFKTLATLMEGVRQKVEAFNLP